MYNRRYDKIYLMLRQETAGYGLQQKTPWGSCVLEIKNGQARLHITAQGLRPRSRGWYGVYAVAEKDGQPRTFFGGELPISPGGQGEVKWDFPADHLGDCQAEDIYAVVVLAREEGGRGLSAPLTAYFGEKREWRSAFDGESHLQAAEAALLCHPREMEAAPVERASFQKEADREEKPQTRAGAAEETGGMMTEGHGSFREMLKKFRREMEELTEMGLLTEEENRRILGMGGPAAAAPAEECVPATREETEEEKIPTETVLSVEEEKIPTETVSSSEEKQTAEAPKEMGAEAAKEQEEPEQKDGETWTFAGHGSLYPFGAAEEWKCILPEEALALGPFYWNRDIFFLSASHRYGHLIARAEGDGLLLGLPEQFREEDRKRAAAMGLVWFRPMEQDPAFGYWIGKVPME